MNWKKIIGWNCFVSACFSFILIVYLNLNFGWFYDYKDPAMLIPVVLLGIGTVLLVLTIGIDEEDTWEWLGDEFEEGENDEG